MYIGEDAFEALLKGARILEKDEVGHYYFIDNPFVRWALREEGGERKVTVE